MIYRSNCAIVRAPAPFEISESDKKNRSTRGKGMKNRTMTPRYEPQRHPENPHVIQLNMSTTLAEQKRVNVSKSECTTISPLKRWGVCSFGQA